MYEGINGFSEFKTVRADHRPELANIPTNASGRVAQDFEPKDNLLEFKPRKSFDNARSSNSIERLSELGLIESEEQQQGYERLFQVCKDMSEHGIARLQEELSVIDDGMRVRLGERFGKGNEWRGLADRNLLRMCQCIDDIEMMQD